MSAPELHTLEDQLGTESFRRAAPDVARPFTRDPTTDCSKLLAGFTARVRVWTVASIPHLQAKLLFAVSQRFGTPGPRVPEIDPTSLTPSVSSSLCAAEE
jgi:hypothetical protein